MALEQRGVEIRHDLIDIATRRQSALARWSGHAEELHRLGLLDEEEMLDMVFYADAAYALVTEELKCGVG
jgi:hypothetical protein